MSTPITEDLVRKNKEYGAKFGDLANLPNKPTKKYIIGMQLEFRDSLLSPTMEPLPYREALPSTALSEVQSSHRPSTQ